MKNRLTSLLLCVLTVLGALAGLSIVPEVTEPAKVEAAETSKSSTGFSYRSYSNYIYRQHNPKLNYTENMNTSSLYNLESWNSDYATLSSKKKQYYYYDAKNNNKKVTTTDQSANSYKNEIVTDYFRVIFCNEIEGHLTYNVYYHKWDDNNQTAMKSYASILSSKPEFTNGLAADKTLVGWYVQRVDGLSNNATRTGNKFAKTFKYRNLDKSNYKYKSTTWMLSSDGADQGKSDDLYLARYQDKCPIGSTTSKGRTVLMYAIWGKKTVRSGNTDEKTYYQVEYKPGGGVGDPMPNSNHVNGAQKTLRKCTYTKSGCTFAGWHLQKRSDSKSIYTQCGKDSARNWYLPGEQPANFHRSIYLNQAIVSQLSVVDGDLITATAVWRPTAVSGKQYFYVDYDANGGNGTMSRTQVPYGTDVYLLPCSFTRPGYHFKQWAGYRVPCITYKTRSVTIKDDNDNNKTIKIPTHVTCGSSIEDTFRLVGSSVWSISPSSVSDYYNYYDQINVHTTSSCDRGLVTMYAIWEKNDSKAIYYNANGGSGSIAAQSCTIGLTATLSTGSGMTNTNSRQIIGWNTAPDGSGTNYELGQQITMPSNNITLYAMWSEAVYPRVFFHSNLDNSKDFNTIISKKDYFKACYHPDYPYNAMKMYVNESNGRECIPYFDDIPEKPGYAFLGWFSDWGSEGEKAFEFHWGFKGVGDYHIYAKWKKVDIIGVEDNSDSLGGSTTDDAEEGESESEGVFDDDSTIGGADAIDYGDLDLQGIQIRHAKGDSAFATDPAYSDRGLRFLTTVKDKFLTSIGSATGRGISTLKYGYVLGATNNITSLGNLVQGSPKTKTVYCTSKYNGTLGTANSDHKLKNGYRYYTMVITYDNPKGNISDVQMLNTNFTARAFVEYTDASGIKRVYYNDYTGTNSHGGCSANYMMALRLLQAGKELVVQ